jgi:general secretion pathway protein A
MYESFYGLSSAPFDVTPNPKQLLLTPTHREALHTLEYGVRSRKGIVLLVGDAGTGKTTLLRKALAMRLSEANGSPAGFVYIKNPKLTSAELFEQLASGFKLPASAMVSKPRMLKLLEEALVAAHAASRDAALIVDEAQSLPDELIEELRLLANIETDDTKLLPLILAGQPELADRLNQHELRQFKQRITLRCELKPFTVQETATYIFARVRMVGGDASNMFTRDAVVKIHEASKGIPRTINVICDNALMTGFAMDKQKVDAATVEEVCRDFDLAGEVRVVARAEAAAAAEDLQIRDARAEDGHGQHAKRQDAQSPVAVAVKVSGRVG